MPMPSTAPRSRHLQVPTRSELVEKAKARLSAPRSLMTLLLMATGGAGFLASYGLLQLGMDRMALRYPLAVGIAYLVFFLLLRLWISLQRDEEWSENAVDLAGDAVEAGLNGIGSPGRVPSGGGGSFGGAGASASFDAPMPVASSSSGIDLPDLDVDLDDNLWILWIVMAVIAAVAAVVFGTVAYVINMAPILLAEVLVDGVLLASLYKRLKGPEPEYWAFGAIKRTWIPALIVAFTFLIAGLAIQDMYPQARSIGEVWTTAPRSSDQR